MPHYWFASKFFYVQKFFYEFVSINKYSWDPNTRCFQYSNCQKSLVRKRHPNTWCNCPVFKWLPFKYQTFLPGIQMAQKCPIFEWFRYSETHRTWLVWYLDFHFKINSLFQAVPLLEEAPLPCINHTYGCQHKDLGKRLALHAPNCLHNPVNYAD